MRQRERVGFTKYPGNFTGSYKLRGAGWGRGNAAIRFISVAPRFYEAFSEGGGEMATTMAHETRNATCSPREIKFFALPSVVRDKRPTFYQETRNRGEKSRDVRPCPREAPSHNTPADRRSLDRRLYRSRLPALFPLQVVCIGNSSRAAIFPSSFRVETNRVESRRRGNETGRVGYG